MPWVTEGVFGHRSMGHTECQSHKQSQKSRRPKEPKEANLVVVSCTVGQPFPFVVAIAQERFFTLGASKMLNVPVLAQGSHNSLLYRSPGKLFSKLRSQGVDDKHLHAPQTGMCESVQVKV